MKLLTCVLFALLGWSQCPASDTEPQHTLLFASGDGGSKFYRIPALATAADGSLVAVADKRIESMGDLPNRIDLVARRSCDNGRTWSAAYPIVEHHSDYGYGDAALVLDRKSGDLLCICASGQGLWASTAEAPIDINIIRSEDNGLTWSEPLRITDQLWGEGCKNPLSRSWHGAFAASGQAVQLRDGTLLFVVAARDNDRGTLTNYVCQSDDGGHNWRVLPTPADEAGDEAKLVELSDGEWLMSIRNPAGKRRKYALSANRGASWSKPQCWEDVITPPCDGDIIRYTLRNEGFRQNRLLHSVPADSLERRNVSVMVSYDEGQSWPICKSVWSGMAGYSSLTVLSDGTIGLLTEVGDWASGFGIYFSRISPEWLTDGKDGYR